MPDLSDCKKGGDLPPWRAAPPFTEGGRKPALVIGGWDPDQDAKVTKTGAEDVLKSVAAPGAQQPFRPWSPEGICYTAGERIGESFEERRQSVRRTSDKCP